ncbi:hypothetical protein DdX_15238 [Ditylenchus destructor]|uniref:Uncharacterized protein n=1 Tax=Ditylenchus destructor TaxID=166010 RepID=A0AAD4QUZ1_9BILA|nr:hypothetical protein DdX_15238 [Ditylenchus destructor]
MCRHIFIWFSQSAINSVILLLFLCLARWYIPTLGSNKIYYNSDNPFIERCKTIQCNNQHNKIRVELAEKILAGANLSRFKYAGSSSSKIRPRLAIAITAADRHNGELSQVMAFLSAHMQSLYPVVICNTEPGGERPSAIRRFENHIPVIDLNTDGGKWQLRLKEERWRKEAHDYWLCMNQTLEIIFGVQKDWPDYLLILEDDAVPIPLFDVAVNSIMDQLDFRTKTDFVKLYRRWDWRSGPKSMQFYQSLIVAINLVGLLQMRLWKNRNIFVIATAVTIVQICWQKYFRQLISDAHFSLTHRVMLTTIENCCTPAVLYRTNRLPNMLNDLWKEQGNKSEPKDVIMDRVAENYVGRLTDINLVVHVGYYSTVSKKYKRVGNK